MEPTGLSGGTLYFAYGANLCRAHMALWCPGAVPLARAVLPGYRLVFRGWADIGPAAGQAVWGALYEVTPADLRSLDRFEDHPALYRRVQVRVQAEGLALEAMAYQMQPGRALRLPAPEHLRLILAGYRDWGLDPRLVRAAAEPSSDSAPPGEGASAPAGPPARPSKGEMR